MLDRDFIRVLTIDLTEESVKVEDRKDLLLYLGGVGVASKLLEETMRPDLSPLSPEQPIVLACGAATSIFPVVTKTVAMFVSPLTGELGESYAGGRLALTMLLAGYDAITITGRAKNPCYVSIRNDTVQIKDARAFWGMDADKVGQFIRRKEPFAGKRSISRIGPAGENLCLFADVCVDTYRHFGRLGLGAVFGSKHLKALQVAGDQSLPIYDTKKYFKIYSELYKTATDTDIMAKYHDAGTPINVEPLSLAGGLPTENLSATTSEYADALSGDTFAQKHLIRKMACTGCPVGCIHIGMFRREFDKGYEYEAVSVGYDYELIFSLGTFLGMKTARDVLELIEAVEIAGMDAISCGVALGWATEALQTGLVSTEQTLVSLSYGEAAGYIEAISHLAKGTNKFYADLAKGVKHASAVYGGIDFAMHIAGNEMPGYHTGYGALIGALVGARHSHLCNAGYAFDQNQKFGAQALADYLFEEEVERCLLNSLIICLFARKVYTRQRILDMFDSLGKTMTDEDLTDTARRIYATKLRIKQKLGFDAKDVKLPERFFKTPSMTGLLNRDMAEEVVKRFCERCALLPKSEK